MELTSEPTKAVVLGTALWGWGVTEMEAFRILDAFVIGGGQIVDCAVNYPINKKTEDFGRANNIVAKWLGQNRGSGLKIFCKIGALDNLGSPRILISASDIFLASEIANGKFGGNLFGVGVHWDNREEADEIEDTVNALRQLSLDGLAVGLSGVRRPELYKRAAPEMSSEWVIQIKENAATSVDRERYTEWFPDARYLAYGINMGGVKTKTPEPGSSVMLRGIVVSTKAERWIELLKEPDLCGVQLKSVPELNMLYAFCNPSLAGFILGPRDAHQLNDSLIFLKSVSQIDRESTWRALNLRISG